MAPTVDDPLGDANRLFRKGDYDGAIQKYRLLLQEKPKSPEPYAGITRSYLKQQKVDEALATITDAMSSNPSLLLRVAYGEVLFRQGQIAEAEREWINVVKAYPSARAYLGLARVKQSLSMSAQFKALIDKAHQLDASDQDIQNLWAGTLPRQQRIEYLTSYLAGNTSDGADARTNLAAYLDYMKQREKEPKRSCRLVSHVTSTETGMVRLTGYDALHLRGYGLNVALNGKPVTLMLDTGASGILVDRKVAEKIGIQKVSDTRLSGIGDRGSASGWFGLASSVRIGELEFQDCLVNVLDKSSVVGEDGLIGSDVFGAFLVDIDFPSEKLRLSPLPSRPDQASQTISLQSADDTTPAEEEHSGGSEASTPAKAAPAADKRFHDRYIDPSMQSYTPVFRFGHHLLIPTKLGESTQKLFLLDTGSVVNHITPRAAQEVTKVSRESHVLIKGISGSVAQVFSADDLVLQFGNLRQRNQEMSAFDLSSLSRSVGTEVSGILGYATLHRLDIKIDYRDGLVDFQYIPLR